MSGSGISWAICKSAPRSKQMTTPELHHSVFLQAGWRMPFLPPNQQRQSTEGTFFLTSLLIYLQRPTYCAWVCVLRGQRSGGRRLDDDVVELDVVSSADRQRAGALAAGQQQQQQQQQQQRRQRRTATSTTTELYSVDDLPRVTHLNDAEVTSAHVFYPRESFREGLWNHRRTFVCLFVCLLPR